MRRLRTLLRLTVAAITVPTVGFQLPGDEEDANLTLEPRLVILVTRHGHRTPITRLAFVDDALWTRFGRCSSPITEEGKRAPPHFPCGEGELTTLGEAQLTELGKWFRERYITNLKLLKPNYDSEEVLVRCTDYSRTILSAENLLRGLYPDINDVTIARAIWKNGRRYVPDPQKCRRLLQMYLQLKETSELHKPLTTEHVLEAKKDVEKILARYNERFPSWIMLSDNFQSLSFIGALPKDFPPTVVALVHRMALLGYWKAMTYNRETIQLGLGLVFNEIQEAMDTRIARDTQPENFKVPHLSPQAIAAGYDTKHHGENVRAILFSNHDTAIVPILTVLQMYDGEWPPFAANIILELSRNRSQTPHSITSSSSSLSSSSLSSSSIPDWFVRVFIDGELKGFLSYAEFRHTLQPYILDDEEYARKCYVPAKVENRSFYF